MNVNQCDISFEGTSSYEHPSFDVNPRVTGSPGSVLKNRRKGERRGDPAREREVSLMDNGDLINKHVD
jgi:hypothetical protein